MDRSFLAGLAHDPEAASLARAVLSFATTLGLRTVAEGIETDEQLAALQQMDCELGQGFLLARPQVPADAEHLLATWAAVPRAACTCSSSSVGSHARGSPAHRHVSWPQCALSISR